GGGRRWRSRRRLLRFFKADGTRFGSIRAVLALIGRVVGRKLLRVVDRLLRIVEDIQPRVIHDPVDEKIGPSRWIERGLGPAAARLPPPTSSATPKPWKSLPAPKAAAPPERPA